MKYVISSELEKRQKFVTRVKAKEAELKEAEKEVIRLNYKLQIW